LLIDRQLNHDFYQSECIGQEAVFGGFREWSNRRLVDGGKQTLALRPTLGLMEKVWGAVENAQIFAQIFKITSSAFDTDVDGWYIHVMLLDHQLPRWTYMIWIKLSY